MVTQGNLLPGPWIGDTVLLDEVWNKERRDRHLVAVRRFLAWEHCHGAADARRWHHSCVFTQHLNLKLAQHILEYLDGPVFLLFH